MVDVEHVAEQISKAMDFLADRFDDEKVQVKLLDRLVIDGPAVSVEKKCVNALEFTYESGEQFIILVTRLNPA
jgi:hypothetical protein